MSLSLISREKNSRKIVICQSLAHVLLLILQLIVFQTNSLFQHPERFPLFSLILNLYALAGFSLLCLFCYKAFRKRTYSDVFFAWQALGVIASAVSYRVFLSRLAFGSPVCFVFIPYIVCLAIGGVLYLCVKHVKAPQNITRKYLVAQGVAHSLLLLLQYIVSYKIKNFANDPQMPSVLHKSLTVLALVAFCLLCLFCYRAFRRRTHWQVVCAWQSVGVLISVVSYFWFITHLGNGNPRQFILMPYIICLAIAAVTFLCVKYIKIR